MNTTGSYEAGTEPPQVLRLPTVLPAPEEACTSFPMTRGLIFALVGVCCVVQGTAAQESSPAPGREAEHVSDFIVFHHEPETRRVLLEVSEATGTVLHVSTLASQVDWPLDRGTIRFDVAPSILSFRMRGDSLEVHGLDPISGSSSVETLPIVGSRSGTWLADATHLLLRDVFGVAETLEWVGENAVFDPARSSVLGSSIEQGPAFAHVDVRTTFEVPGGSAWLESRAADPEILTVVQRHIFFTTDSGFAFIPTDRRVGINGVPLADVEQSDTPGNRVPRWRALIAPDLTGERTPLQVYLDPAIPNEHKAALKRAVGYWDRALRSNGGTGRLEIRDLPPEADPLSLRYPVVILWVDRPQPMSSMANLIADPRSGELVKGIIQLDSHWPVVAANEYRAYRPALSASAPTEAEYVNDRMGWVAAHEFGHLLGGLAHTISKPTAVGWQRPALFAGPAGVEIDLGRTLPEQAFAYDLWTLRYAYPGCTDRDSTAWTRFFESGAAEGYWPVPPPVGRASPDGVNRAWGPDYPAGLESARQVRNALLRRFDASVLDPGEPAARVFERLFPAYFHHRYALLAVVRMTGGLTREAGSMDFRPVSADAQRSAIESIIEALSPAELQVPQAIVDLVPASASDAPGLRLRGESTDGSSFSYQTGNSGPIEVPSVPSSGFAPTDWARVLSRTTIENLLHPVRLARMEEQAGSDKAFPGPDDLLTRLTEEMWSLPPESDPELLPYDKVRKRALIESYLDLLSDDDLPETVRSAVHSQLRDLRDAIVGVQAASDSSLREFYEETLRMLDPVTVRDTSGRVD